jgi:hypothetical protein
VYVHDPGAFVPIQACLQRIATAKCRRQSLDFFNLEALRLKRDAGSISRAVVHEPSRNGGWF